MICVHTRQGIRVKKIFFAIAGLAATTVLANAADVNSPVYRTPPTMPPPHVVSWTGCYGGGHIGWGFERTTFTDSSPDNVSDGHGGLIDPASLQQSVSDNLSGVLLGGQIGCDYQFNNFYNMVIGISGSAAGADINGTAQDPLVTFGPGGLLTAKTDFLADISGRLGFTWNQFLLYGKGGIAWSHNKYIADTCLCTFAAVSAFTGSDTASAPVAGAGIEWTVAQNWSAFVEYDHYFFKAEATNFSAAGSAAGPLTGSVNVKPEIDAVKVGMNYRLNSNW
jgi:outer membrane immunogenic protein